MPTARARLVLLFTIPVSGGQHGVRFTRQWISAPRRYHLPATNCAHPSYTRAGPSWVAFFGIQSGEGAFPVTLPLIEIANATPPPLNAGLGFASARRRLARGIVRARPWPAEEAWFCGSPESAR
jgi:hypothetical protein